MERKHLTIHRKFIAVLEVNNGSVNNNIAKEQHNFSHWKLSKIQGPAPYFQQTEML